MTKNEFITWLEEHKDALTTWNIVLDEENMSDDVAGCFFDSKTGNWKVYINKERGRHRIRLETNDEAQAFDNYFCL